MTVDAPYPRAWDRAPDLAGPAGQAWRWQLTEEEIAAPEATARIDEWLIHQPASHPLWCWYLLAMIHLRGDLDGRPAHKHFPDAAYEVMVVALDPSAPIREPAGIPGRDDRPPMAFLRPTDQIHQFAALPRGDDQAREFCELLARSVVKGVLICDQDHRRSWATSIAATVEHYRAGVH